MPEKIAPRSLPCPHLWAPRIATLEPQRLPPRTSTQHASVHEHFEMWPALRLWYVQRIASRTKVKVKPAKPAKLGTQRARLVVDTKGKVCCARFLDPQQEDRERGKKPAKVF